MASSNRPPLADLANSLPEENSGIYKAQLRAHWLLGELSNELSAESPQPSSLECSWNRLPRIRSLLRYTDTENIGEDDTDMLSPPPEPRLPHEANNGSCTGLHEPPIGEPSTRWSDRKAQSSRKSTASPTSSFIERSDLKRTSYGSDNSLGWLLRSEHQSSIPVEDTDGPNASPISEPGKNGIASYDEQMNAVTFEVNEQPGPALEHMPLGGLPENSSPNINEEPGLLAAPAYPGPRLCLLSGSPITLGSAALHSEMRMSPCSTGQTTPSATNTDTQCTSRRLAFAMQAISPVDTSAGAVPVASVSSAATTPSPGNNAVDFSNLMWNSSGQCISPVPSTSGLSSQVLEDRHAEQGTVMGAPDATGSARRSSHCSVFSCGTMRSSAADLGDSYHEFQKTHAWDDSCVHLQSECKQETKTRLLGSPVGCNPTTPCSGSEHGEGASSILLQTILLPVSPQETKHAVSRRGGHVISPIQYSGATSTHNSLRPLRRSLSCSGWVSGISEHGPSPMSLPLSPSNRLGENDSRSFTFACYGELPGDTPSFSAALYFQAPSEEDMPSLQHSTTLSVFGQQHSARLHNRAAESLSLATFTARKLAVQQRASVVDSVEAAKAALMVLGQQDAILAEEQGRATTPPYRKFMRHLHDGDVHWIPDKKGSLDPLCKQTALQWPVAAQNAGSKAVSAVEALEATSPTSESRHMVPRDTSSFAYNALLAGISDHQYFSPAMPLAAPDADALSPDQGTAQALQFSPTFCSSESPLQSRQVGACGAAVKQNTASLDGNCVGAHPSELKCCPISGLEAGEVHQEGCVEGTGVFANALQGLQGSDTAPGGSGSRGSAQQWGCTVPSTDKVMANMPEQQLDPSRAGPDASDAKACCTQQSESSRLQNLGKTAPSQPHVCASEDLEYGMHAGCEFHISPLKSTSPDIVLRCQQAHTRSAKQRRRAQTSNGVGETGHTSQPQGEEPHLGPVPGNRACVRESGSTVIMGELTPRDPVESTCSNGVLCGHVTQSPLEAIPENRSNAASSVDSQVFQRVASPCSVFVASAEPAPTSVYGSAGPSGKAYQPNSAPPLSPVMCHVESLHRSLECIHRIAGVAGTFPEQLDLDDYALTAATPQCSEMVAAVQRACQAAQQDLAGTSGVVDSDTDSCRTERAKEREILELRRQLDRERKMQLDLAQTEMSEMNERLHALSEENASLHEAVCHLRQRRPSHAPRGLDDGHIPGSPVSADLLAPCSQIYGALTAVQGSLHSVAGIQEASGKIHKKALNLLISCRHAKLAVTETGQSDAETSEHLQHFATFLGAAKGELDEHVSVLKERQAALGGDRALGSRSQLSANLSLEAAVLSLSAHMDGLASALHDWPPRAARPVSGEPPVPRYDGLPTQAALAIGCGPHGLSAMLAQQATRVLGRLDSLEEAVACGLTAAHARSTAASAPGPDATMPIPGPATSEAPAATDHHRPATRTPDVPQSAVSVDWSLTPPSAASPLHGKHAALPMGLVLGDDATADLIRELMPVAYHECPFNPLFNISTPAFDESPHVAERTLSRDALPSSCTVPKAEVPSSKDSCPNPSGAPSPGRGRSRIPRPQSASTSPQRLISMARSATVVQDAEVQTSPATGLVPTTPRGLRPSTIVLSSTQSTPTSPREAVPRLARDRLRFLCHALNVSATPFLPGSRSASRGLEQTPS